MVRKTVLTVLCIAAVLAVILPLFQVQLQRKQYRMEMRAWMRSDVSLKRDTITIDFPGVIIEDAHEISVAGVMYDVLGVTWYQGKPAWVCVEDSYEKVAFREISRQYASGTVHSTHPGKLTLQWPESNWIESFYMSISLMNETRICHCEKGGSLWLSQGFCGTSEPPPQMIQHI